LASGLAVLFLFACWPLLDEQDYIPVYPFAVLFASSVLMGAQSRVAPSSSPAAAAGDVPVQLWVPCLTGALMFACLPAIYPLPGPGARSFDHRQLIADVLRYTDRDDPVADRKGETVYRRRPMWYVLETVTRDRLVKGLATDDIAKRLVDSGTTVAVLSHYTPKADEFVRRNYLAVSRRLGVAGRFLAIRPVAAGTAVQFRVEIPTTYVVAAEGQEVDGVLDGEPFHHARRLDSGMHWFRPGVDCNDLTLVWAKAFDRGYRPEVPKPQEVQ
jgi:hypothetical protein